MCLITKPGHVSNAKLKSLLSARTTFQPESRIEAGRQVADQPTRSRWKSLLLNSILCFWRNASKADYSNAEFLAELNRSICIVILVSEGTNEILTSEVLTTADRGFRRLSYAISPSSCERSHGSIGNPSHKGEPWLECICLNTRW
jgi:hypothetical protein